MVTYSDWIWSKEQQRYYAAVYDDEGEIVEYHWQGGYRQYVQRTKPPHEPSASVADPTASMTAAMSGLSMSTAEASTPRSAQRQSTSNTVGPVSSTAASLPAQAYKQTGSAATSPHYLPAAPASSPFPPNAATPDTSRSPPVHRTNSQSGGASYFDYHPHSKGKQGSSNISPQQYMPSQPYTSSQQHNPAQTYTPGQSHTDTQTHTTLQQYSPWLTNPSSQQYATSHSHTTSQQYPPTHPHTMPAQSPAYSQARPAASGPLPSSIQEVVGGDKKSRHIKTGDDGSNYEKLHPSFKRVPPREHDDFFCRGRVFKMLWTEPAGMVNPGVTRGSTHYSLVRFNENAYSEIRRFVVIQNKGNFSQCIPIQSYRGQGATKPGLVVSDHAIIYTGFPGAKPPMPFAGEENMLKQAIRVQPHRTEALNEASRINFGKPYAVEHNVKLAEIGTVADEHLHILVTYFMRAMGLPIY